MQGNLNVYRKKTLSFWSDAWNLLTRNTQMVVSGLYYWSVEDYDGRTQVGNLAIIM